MSSIGYGPGIGSGPKVEANAVRPVSTSETPAANNGPAPASAQPAPAASPAQGAAMVATTALNAGKPPVDTDRVATIKKAIQTGNYPLVPSKISDAMIAAGIMLRVPK